ncbi:hypothetical protein BJ138DRAFT_781406 [Hygrophoropsis aurantiaca]|uniref:Uncharacterized protein n=1 Tax=Hygrophoropsis aurantiaca TaxID=72124 RepID=A0ACB8AID8_9AGAM|nr:hypothetical protein BJ138DRAFT_781406 [Hygrophoropsis aurantiaca]
MCRDHLPVLFHFVAIWMTSFASSAELAAVTVMQIGRCRCRARLVMTESTAKGPTSYPLRPITSHPQSKYPMNPRARRTIQGGIYYIPLVTREDCSQHQHSAVFCQQNTYKHSH